MLFLKFNSAPHVTHPVRDSQARLLGRKLKSVLSMAFLTLTLCLTPTVSASPMVPAPKLKPSVPNTSTHLSDRDAKYFRSGFRAAKRNDWLTVAKYHKKISDRTAKNILLWMRASLDANVRFEEMTYVSHSLGDWPRMTRIRAKAEAKLWDNPISAQKTKNWFQGQEPVSGEGRAALARAYYQSGDKETGDRWLKYAWRESKLTRDRQKAIFKAYGNRLSKNDHDVRADYLIWLGSRHFSKVTGLLGLMTPANRNLANARMKVALNGNGMDAAIKAVPSTLRNDTGLLFERARWRRKRKSKDYALPVYLKVKAPPVSENGKKRLWTERKIMTYWAIEKRQYDTAYKLTLNHGFERGSQFAEAEFLAGWLALTKLNRAQTAQKHFQRLHDNVSFPVSKSRASYWLGRTSEILGDGQAPIHYLAAAKFQNTYYGLLAGNKIDGRNARISLPPEASSSAFKSAYLSDPRVKAMQILGELGDEKTYTYFSFHLDDKLNALEELSLLSATAKEFGYMRPSIRAAKQASRFQSMLTNSGYPLIDPILTLKGSFDIPFVFAIARQESEFNYKAVSSARAYGLMQMINSTAKTTARQHRLPYSRSRMTTDINYSARLGALHLHDLLRQYDGSYIMAAAAYNAGPSRVRKWISTYGDPRKGDIDPIDWLESLPFSETRNYVHRVMENLEVYRARLNNNQSENRLYQNLTKGAF